MVLLDKQIMNKKLIKKFKYLLSDDGNKKYYLDIDDEVIEINKKDMK